MDVCMNVKMVDLFCESVRSIDEPKAEVFVYTAYTRTRRDANTHAHTHAHMVAGGKQATRVKYMHTQTIGYMNPLKNGIVVYVLRIAYKHSVIYRMFTLTIR